MAVQSAIVDNGLGLVVVDVGMALQLAEREAVDIQTAGTGTADDEILLGRLREVGNLVELVDADVAAEEAPVIHYLVGKVDADAGDASQLGGVGGIEDNVLAGFNLHGIAQGVATIR